MSKFLAIYYDQQFDYSLIKKYIEQNYKDWCFIYDVISIPQITNTAILHYTEIRMRGVDVLVTNIEDIYKVDGFNNTINYLISKKPKLFTLKYSKYLDLCTKIKNIWSLGVEKDIINKIMHYEGEIKYV